MDLQFNENLSNLLNKLSRIHVLTSTRRTAQVLKRVFHEIIWIKLLILSKNIALEKKKERKKKGDSYMESVPTVHFKKPI